jgi:hypothetical protein
LGCKPAKIKKTEENQCRTLEKNECHWICAWFVPSEKIQEEEGTAGTTHTDWNTRFLATGGIQKG